MLERSIVKLAKAMANVGHKGQKYGKEIYWVHLDDVAHVLQRFGLGRDNLIAAAYLHDIVEDTVFGLEDVELQGMPKEVIMIVDALTDDVKGKTRAEKKARPYVLIPAVPDAIVVKLADRIANVEACHANGKFKMLKRYQEEYPGFIDALRSEDVALNEATFKQVSLMWTYLDTILTPSTETERWKDEFS